VISQTESESWTYFSTSGKWLKQNDSKENEN